jgi:serine/threonine protein kinase
MNIDIRNKFLTQYLVVEKIGEGSYGIVHKCKHIATGSFVAVKRTKEKYEGAKDRFQKMEEVLKLF